MLAATALAQGAQPHSESAGQSRYVLKRVARGLQEPLYVTTAPGEPDRLYVVLRRGTVRVIRNGRLLPAPLLDLRRRVTWSGEMGLLSIAFHPDYRSNRLVYAVFNEDGDDDPVTVVEYRVANGRVDRTTERVLVRVPHPESPYHNGGQLQFGPDGKLYVSVGDGGYIPGARLTPDPHGNAQNTGVLLGKIFRLDVTSPSPEPEIVAYGLRNPWRFSFAPNGDMLIADVGWNTAEEVDVLPSGSGLVNFGWSVYEGRSERPGHGELNPAGRLLPPVFTYRNQSSIGNCSITGGYVYRGRIRSLRGRYVFGDYCSGRIWSIRLAEGGASGLRREPVRVPDLVSFGVDGRGELYAVSFGGSVYGFAPS